MINFSKTTPLITFQAVGAEKMIMDHPLVQKILGEKASRGNIKNLSEKGKKERFKTNKKIYNSFSARINIFYDRKAIFISSNANDLPDSFFIDFAVINDNQGELIGNSLNEMDLEFWDGKNRDYWLNFKFLYQIVESKSLNKKIPVFAGYITLEEGGEVKEIDQVFVIPELILNSEPFKMIKGNDKLKEFAKEFKINPFDLVRSDTKSRRRYSIKTEYFLVNIN